MDKETASLEESIRQLDQEIVIDPAQSPMFIAVLCLPASDLSENAQVPPEKTLYATYILPKTSFILLAHETCSRVTNNLKHIYNMPLFICKRYPLQTTCYLEGTAQILAFDTFRNLMKTKYDQDI